MPELKPRRLALFDLDNTLLAGDSDHAWGEFLISKKLVDEVQHQAENDRFYQQYKDGELDIHGYVAFTLQPILNLDNDARNRLHEEFLSSAVKAIVLEKSQALVKQHRDAGDFCVIITATNNFIAAPIAALFDIDLLIATDLVLENDRYNGQIDGIPCYQVGKVEKLQHWLTIEGTNLSLQNSIFYSDSINDLPLMELVSTAIAVDPDENLAAVAVSNNWEVMTLRD